jgi:hypothetical protein
MNKKYVKPAMAIETIELENMIASSPGVYMDATANSGSKGLSKEREEIWEEDTDLWGNDCWTRVE